MKDFAPCRARALRLRYGISLSELAGAMGISIQLVNKIELERERQTPGHEQALRRAFTVIIDRRRTQMDALEQELAGCGGLFQTINGDDEHGI